VESGFDYRGARFYDSDVARFNSLDPLAVEFPEWSDYNYVLGNPLAYVDKDGKSAEIIIKGNTITIKATIYTQGLSDALVKDLNDNYSNYIQNGTYTDGAGNKYNVKFVLEYEEDKISRFNKNNIDEEINTGRNLLKVVKDPKDCTVCHKTGRSVVRWAGGSYGELTGEGKYHPSTIFHESAHFLGLDDRYKGGYPDPSFGPDLMNDASANFSQVHIDNIAGAALFNYYYLGKKSIDWRVDFFRGKIAKNGYFKDE